MRGSRGIGLASVLAVLALLLLVTALLSDNDGDRLPLLLELVLSTDIGSPDTDGDGLLDGAEIALGCSPLSEDTDSDGLQDGYEVRLGISPVRSWRLRLDAEAVKAALSLHYRRNIRALASMLSSQDLVETVWSVLAWVDENLSYDYAKEALEEALLDDPPTVLLRSRRGICGDYALATAALLLEAGVQEVYVIVLEFEHTELKHAAAMVRISGDYFVLDQHLPPMQLGGYVKYLERIGGDKVSGLRALRASLLDTSEVAVEEISLGEAETGMFRPNPSALREAVSNVLEGRGLAEDRRLRNCAREWLKCVFAGAEICRINVPRAYERGLAYTIAIPVYYLDTPFLEKFVEHKMESIPSRGETLLYKAFYVEVELHEEHVFITEKGRAVTMPTYIVSICLAGRAH